MTLLLLLLLSLVLIAGATAPLRLLELQVTTDRTITDEDRTGFQIQAYNDYTL